MGWTCFKCKTLTRLIGIGALAVLIAPDPESEAALSAIKTVWGMMVHHYGEQISLGYFIEKTQTLAGELDDFTFILYYPDRVCEWFGKC